MVVVVVGTSATAAVVVVAGTSETVGIASATGTSATAAIEARGTTTPPRTWAAARTPQRAVRMTLEKV